MARANPNSLCTKWVEQSDAMTDDEHAEMDRESAERKAFYDAETEAERRARQRRMDSAPLVNNRPFSIFADDGRDHRGSVVTVSIVNAAQFKND